MFACRLKRPASAEIERRIRSDLAPLEQAGRARFFNQVDRIHDLNAASDLVVLPAESTYAKMDLPLVLIEALAIGRPIVVADRPPLTELPVDRAGCVNQTPSEPVVAPGVSEINGGKPQRLLDYVGVRTGVRRQEHRRTSPERCRGRGERRSPT